MDFSLSEDQRAFQETARAFATEHFAPNAARWDEEKIFPEAQLRQAAELGFGGIYVRDEVGGSGLSRLDAAMRCEPGRTYFVYCRISFVLSQTVTAPLTSATMRLQLQLGPIGGPCCQAELRPLARSIWSCL